MYAGPKLQNDISIIITRWRMHKIVFCADIKMMYRQFRVRPDHVNFQRIVWSRSSRQPIKHYALLTVTYGTNCAPYLASFFLKIFFCHLRGFAVCNPAFTPEGKLIL